METHLGALEADGSTIIVLAEGITHFRKKRAFSGLRFDEENVLAVSQFPPTQPWTAGAAMTRNAVIAGLSQAMLVVEAGEKGGTLNAGLQAIEMGRPVYAIAYADDPPPATRRCLSAGRTHSGARTNCSSRSISSRTSTSRNSWRLVSECARAKGDHGAAPVAPPRDRTARGGLDPVGCVNSVATPDALICRRIEFVHPTAVCGALTHGGRTPLRARTDLWPRLDLRTVHGRHRLHRLIPAQRDAVCTSDLLAFAGGAPDPKTRR